MNQFIGPGTDFGNPIWASHLLVDTPVLTLIGVEARTPHSKSKQGASGFTIT
jgi:hypothetical protein